MIDCSKCRVDPSDKDFVQKFRGLHPDFEEELLLSDMSEGKFFTYIVFTYDVNSPYVVKHKDWAQRRRETAQAADFPIKNGKYTTEAESIIIGRGRTTNKFIMRYLFLQNDTDFIRLQGYQAMLYSQMMGAMDPSSVDPSKSATLKKNIDNLTADIKSLQKQVFHGEETKEMLMALYDYAANISYDFRPEHIASKKEKGEEIVDESPYKKSYTVESLRFLDDE